MRVTHPFHPLNGRQLPCVGERYNRYGMTLPLETDEGSVCSVPPQWTDVVAPDPEIILGGQRALFRVADFKSLYQKRPLGACRCALLRCGRSRYSTRTCWNLSAWWIGSVGTICRRGTDEMQGKIRRDRKWKYAAKEQGWCGIPAHCAVQIRVRNTSGP